MQGNLTQYTDTLCICLYIQISRPPMEYTQSIPVGHENSIHHHINLHRIPHQVPNAIRQVIRQKERYSHVLLSRWTMRTLWTHLSWKIHSIRGNYSYSAHLLTYHESSYRFCGQLPISWKLSPSCHRSSYWEHGLENNKVSWSSLLLTMCLLSVVIESCICSTGSTDSSLNRITGIPSFGSLEQFKLAYILISSTITSSQS